MRTSAAIATVTLSRESGLPARPCRRFPILASVVSLRFAFVVCHHFFARRSFSAALSSMASANRFFSLVFSLSSLSFPKISSAGVRA